MNFPAVFKGVLAILIQQAEAELGGGKGAEKKKWVLDKLREALVNAKLHSVLVNIVVAIADLAIEWIKDAALDALGK